MENEKDEGKIYEDGGKKTRHVSRYMVCTETYHSPSSLQTAWTLVPIGNLSERSDMFLGSWCKNMWYTRSYIKYMWIMWYTWSYIKYHLQTDHFTHLTTDDQLTHLTTDNLLKSTREGRGRSLVWDVQNTHEKTYSIDRVKVLPHANRNTSRKQTGSIVSLPHTFIIYQEHDQL